jgi:type VI secretion system protein ImpA
MATPEVLDFVKLLAPLPGEKPAGTDLRVDPSPVSDFYVIRDARKAASDAERRLDQGDDAVTVDWRPVMERGAKALAEKSKDLEITAYLIESLVRLRGFAGLRDGFRLARELLERFWDGLYPASEDGDVETRFSHVLWLSGIDKPGTLIVPVRKIPLCQSSSLGNLSLAHYLQAQSLEQIADAKVKQMRIDGGSRTLEQVRSAVAETPPQFFADLLDDLDQAAQEFHGFGETLSKKSGYDVPSSDLKGVIEAYRDAIQALARDKILQARAAAAPQPAPTPDGAAPAPGPAAAAAKPVDPLVIKDRADAMDRLLKVATYFRTHEPQSIIPYALEQIVNWGKMSLPELLSELIPEEGPRKNLFKQVGIKAPETKK